MLYRSKTDRVLCLVIIMATRSGIPARTRFLTAVRRKSWGIRPGAPAFLQAVFQDRLNSLIGLPARLKTQGQMMPRFFKAAARAFWPSRTALSSSYCPFQSNMTLPIFRLDKITRKRLSAANSLWYWHNQVSNAGVAISPSSM